MQNRSKRKQIAQENLQIFEQGFFFTQKNEKIFIKQSLEKAKKATQVIKPSDFDTFFDEIRKNDYQNYQTIFEVRNQSSLSAAKNLLESGQEKVFVLNFASAKNPGGGFLNGSQAQEESLARASGLYPCLLEGKEMYEHNRGLKTALYSDYAIYTPFVPVFRNDNDELLEKPYKISFYTAPAPNAGALQQNEAHNLYLVPEVMRVRIERMLAFALYKGYSSLVLGAWGCGVFQNQPENIAQNFYEAFFENELLQNKFEKVVFAIFSKNVGSKNLQAFEQRFS